MIYTFLKDSDTNMDYLPFCKYENAPIVVVYDFKNQKNIHIQLTSKNFNADTNTLTIYNQRYTICPGCNLVYPEIITRLRAELKKEAEEMGIYYGKEEVMNAIGFYKSEPPIPIYF